nr:hypothetical protein [uncultured Acetatifactor sp.]
MKRKKGLSENMLVDGWNTKVCIINPNCIKGYFSPMLPDSEWNMV